MSISITASITGSDHPDDAERLARIAAHAQDDLEMRAGFSETVNSTP